MSDSSNALERFAEAYIDEQRRKRRWKWITRTCILLFIMTMVFISQFSAVETLIFDKPHVGLIDISGVIQEKGQGSADNVAGAIHRAYASKGLRGLILRINSPGGSPVQADYIFQEIRRRRIEKPKVPIYAVCTDLCASAAYYIAAAADNIYANESSLVGSIGVIYNGFGVTDLMAKVGVKSRILTSGKNKAMMNPFLPESAAAKAHMQKMLDVVHKRFISRVQEGRSSRLSNDPDLYSGLVWSGEKAKQLGLIDDFSSDGTLARHIFSNARVIDYTERPGFMDKLTNQLGTQLKMMLLSSGLG
jgi:protease-4